MVHGACSKSTLVCVLLFATATPASFWFLWNSSYYYIIIMQWYIAHITKVYYYSFPTECKVQWRATVLSLKLTTINIYLEVFIMLILKIYYYCLYLTWKLLTSMLWLGHNFGVDNYLCVLVISVACIDVSRCTSSDHHQQSHACMYVVPGVECETCILYTPQQSHAAIIIIVIPGVECESCRCIHHPMSHFCPAIEYECPVMNWTSNHH